MAEGAYDPDDVFRNTIYHSVFDDDDDQEPLSKTQPFQPGEASTPYHRGEDFEMQTRHQEHTGLPSYEEEETSFGGNDRAPLTKKDSFENLERRLLKLKRNKVTGILDISEVPNPKEDFLPVEVKNEQKERAIRFIKSRYPEFNKKGLVITHSKKKSSRVSLYKPKGWRNQNL